MAATDISTREMIRGTLSHEVRQLIVNLGLRINAFEDLRHTLDARQKVSFEERISKNISAIELSAKSLFKRVGDAEAQLKSNGIPPNEIFQSTELLNQARMLPYHTIR